MKISHIWSVACSNVITDKDTNTISLIEVIESLNVQIHKGINDLKDFPINKNLNIVSMFETDFKPNEKESEIEIKIEYNDPKGNLIKDFEMKVQTDRRYARFRNVVQINGIQCRGEGKYEFVIYYKENKKYVECGSVQIDMKFQSEKISD